MRSAIVISLIFSATSFGQTPASDADVSRALLVEVRQLRQDLQTTAIAIQRVQLVMFRMQMATTTLSRATQRLDEVRNRCNYIQPQRKGLLLQIEQAESRLRSVSSPPDQRTTDEIARMKGTVEALSVQEQQCQTSVMEAENQVRTEQTKMNDIQDQFDKLDRALADVARK